MNEDEVGLLMLVALCLTAAFCFWVWAKYVNPKR